MDNKTWRIVKKKKIIIGTHENCRSTRQIPLTQPINAVFRQCCEKFEEIDLMDSCKEDKRAALNKP